MKTLKIGLDIHGVVDTIPSFFSELTRLFVEAGHEVHIITGEEEGENLLNQLNGMGIRYTHLFSISSYHKKMGTKITYDEKNTPWMDHELWNKTKGEYCHKHGIDVHLDDSDDYWKHFTTPYILFKRRFAS